MDHSYETDEDEFDVANLPPRSQANRTKRPPIWLGVDYDIGQFSSSEGSDFSADDQDEVYNPPPKKKRVGDAVIVASKAIASRESQLDVHHGEDASENASALSSEYDFDSQFQELSKKSPAKCLSSHGKETEKNLTATHHHFNVESSSVTEVIPIENNEHAQAHTTADLMCKIDELSKENGRQFNLLQKKINELLAKQSVLEKMLINGEKYGTATIEGPKLASVNDANIEAFVVSNDLPIRSIHTLTKFDAQLKGDAFRTTTVRIFEYEYDISC